MDKWDVLYAVSVTGVTLWWMSDVPWSDLPGYAVKGVSIVGSWIMSIDPGSVIVVFLYLCFIVSLVVKERRGDFKTSND